MRTLILYATKHGAAAEIARRISTHFEDPVVHDLRQGGAPPLDGFGCVIVGGSLYAGMVRKEAKSFVQQNIAALRGKRLGLFVSGLEGSKEKEYFDTNFSADIIGSVKAAYFLGGIFDPKKAGVMERMIMKAVSKQSEYTDNINDVKIKQFAEVMKS